MTDHVYKIIEIARTSSKSIDDAVNNALQKHKAQLETCTGCPAVILRIKN